MKFEDLQLSVPLLRALAAEGYETPTPIQQQAIPHVMEGRDLLGCAQTGTGKTAAFALPILHRLALAPRPPKHGRPIRTLVLSPTRELAVQIADSFDSYGRHLFLRHTIIYGGVNQNPQTRALYQGIDIVVATPGRLLDLMNQGFVDLSKVETFVLDEADQMLDMGFIHDIRRIVAKLPAERQTLFFSATMPAEIRSLADAILRDPAKVQISAESSTVDAIEQSLYHVDRANKPALLQHVLRHTATGRTLVFTRTKHGADKVATHLERAGIDAEAIHGNKSQNARRKALDRFRSQRPPVLVATDVAARGLDIDAVSHVINFDLPNVPETYVHRIGRTGRAGATGVAISFCSGDERGDLRSIERLIRKMIPVRSDQPAALVSSQPQSAPGNQSGGEHRGKGRYGNQRRFGQGRSSNGQASGPRSGEGKPFKRRFGKPGDTSSRSVGGHGGSHGASHASAPAGGAAAGNAPSQGQGAGSANGTSRPKRPFGHKNKFSRRKGTVIR